MRYHDEWFQSNSQFVFLLFNQVQHHGNSRGVAMRFKSHVHEAEAVLNIINDPGFEKQIENCVKNPESVEAREMNQFL